MTNRISAPWLVLLALLVFIPCTVSGQAADRHAGGSQPVDTEPVDPEPVDPELLEEIQRQCLLAYAPEMLRELYGSEALPDPADDARPRSTAWST